MSAVRIAVKLDPERLPDPDADLRHAIPSRVVTEMPNAVVGVGFGYLVDDTMVLFFETQAKRTQASYWSFSVGRNLRQRNTASRNGRGRFGRAK